MSREIVTSIWIVRDQPGSDETDLCVDVFADYTPATPDVRYLPNGDPGHPGNEDEVEITEVSHYGDVIELTAEEHEKAVEAVIEKANR